MVREASGHTQMQAYLHQADRVQKLKAVSRVPTPFTRTGLERRTGHSDHRIFPQRLS